MYNMAAVSSSVEKFNMKNNPHQQKKKKWPSHIHQNISAITPHKWMDYIRFWSYNSFKTFLFHLSLKESLFNLIFLQNSLEVYKP